VNITTITANIKKSCDDLGQIDLSGIKLEEAGAQLLNVSEMEFDQHVAIQPSAITFFGVLRKEVNRRVDAYKKSYDRWQKKMYAQAKVAVLSGTQDYKPTVADIEARFIVDNEEEIEKREKQLEKLRDEADTIDAWYEGWRQKSFTIREWAGIELDEKFQGGGSISADEPDSGSRNSGSEQRATRGGETKELKPDSIKRVREMMKKHKEKAEKKKLATRA